MSSEVHDGRSAIALDGLSYLPRFISAEEADALIAYFAGLAPLWEQRHCDNEHARSGVCGGRITRPVYWLGAWQFACLGYYAEPDHREGRCVRAEPIPMAMQTLLHRLRPALERHDHSAVPPPLHNTCLINYYGSKLGKGPPIDQARLRMHRDLEPGPIVVLCLGQPGLLEFVEPEQPCDPKVSLWTRHRSVAVFSGTEYKERLYHRVTKVKHGSTPHVPSPVPDFSVRRISVSFRHVPEQLITDLEGLPPAARDQVTHYIEELAHSSSAFAAQLRDPALDTRG